MLSRIRILPTYIFTLRCYGSPQDVMDRVRALIVEKMGFFESLRAARDVLHGRVSEASFDAKPMASWAGNRRSRPRIRGVVREDASGTILEVSVSTRLLVLIAVLVVMVIGIAIRVDVVVGILFGIVGIAISIASHIAEGRRAERLLLPVAFPSDVK